MTHLVIGHTTPERARVWVQASPPARFAFLEVDGRGRRPVALSSAGVATVDLEGFEPGQISRVEVAFGATARGPDAEGTDRSGSTGRVQTFPRRGARARFLLGSCNFPTFTRRAWGRRGHGRLREIAEQRGVDFMLHGGDQIYFDLPNPWARPSAEAYRRRYRRAWSGDPQLGAVLRTIPNYMIFDDHELVDGFANDRRYWYRRRRAIDFRAPALAAYRDMVHARQPHTFGSGPLYYAFAHGDVQVFVLDARSERWLGAGNAPAPQLVSAAQLDALGRWMVRHADAPKFVLTPVPFVFRVKGDFYRRNDKWTGPLFRAQRARLLRTIARARVRRLCFLTGDMHTSGHATMEVRGHGHRVTVHELMASPLRQFEYGGEGQFERSWHERHASVDAFSEIEPGTVLRGPDNAMLIDVADHDLRWETFATRRVQPSLRSGTIAWG